MKKHFLLLWLLLLGSIGLAAAQSRQIQGVVKSAEGEGLPGVTVLVEGTTNGASTGGDGAYSITLPATGAGAGAKLRFSYVGFTLKEVTVGDQSIINVTLAANSKQLEDVVVVGYQEVQRRDVTGAVSSVGAQQIKDVPVNSAAEALTGRLAGVQLTSAEGTPGNANVQIRVRGGSITQDNSPLYVVDGIQVENALSVISPQDIQSVDVLKDASATAIYGARGANGVVIITTKKGREGKVVISYNGFAGIRQLSRQCQLDLWRALERGPVGPRVTSAARPGPRHRRRADAGVPAQRGRLAQGRGRGESRLHAPAERGLARRHPRRQGPQRCHHRQQRHHPRN